MCKSVYTIGLFNEAIGTVVDIIYKTGCNPINYLPEVVMVEFPNYSGSSFTEENPKIVPIVPVVIRLECSCHSCSRNTIPLKLGWATTIHKCQGMTIGEGEPNRYIVIHPGAATLSQEIQEHYSLQFLEQNVQE